MLIYARCACARARGLHYSCLSLGVLKPNTTFPIHVSPVLRFVPLRCETFAVGISIAGHLDLVCLMTRLFCRLPRLCACVSLMSMNPKRPQMRRNIAPLQAQPKTGSNGRSPR
ncbi:hypothetical protein CGRA01v4_03410 [Colletotrichum graminicola]|nr:hypothetical protein CGRA01v4_03410 [Colletotrichum graminicola]